MNTTYIFIKYAKGEDGGFGDYATPDWSIAPILKDARGNPVWFSDMDEAEKFIELCNKKSNDHFYSNVKTSAYDGNFPVEYEAILLEIPDSAPCTNAEAAFSTLEDKIKHYALQDPMWDEE